MSRVINLPPTNLITYHKKIKDRDKKIMFEVGVSNDTVSLNVTQSTWQLWPIL